MSKFLVGARRPALCAVSVASMLAGGVTLWAILDPETVRAASTWLLLGVLALMSLPLLTLAAFETDRRHRAARQAARRAQLAARQEALAREIQTRDLAIAAMEIDFEIPSSVRDAETVAVRHEPSAGANAGSVSARRAARSAPGRSRAALRR